VSIIPNTVPVNPSIGITPIIMLVKPLEYFLLIKNTVIKKVLPNIIQLVIPPTFQ